jgi:N utilization substance protein A
LEISLEEAKTIDKKLELGDIVKIEIKPKKDFGRIAAQTARQVILQKIREAERESIFSEFYGRESDILTGVVQRENKGNIFVDLGKIEGILSLNEQIPGEVYNIGDRIKTVILEVKNTGKGANIMLSRSHPNLVKRLFELEVPEIHDGIIEIYSIAREAGSRTKIAVFSHDPNVEPIGSCVGNKGVRVKNIIDEINQEKIDIIIYEKDPEKFIANSLGPAKIVMVTVNEKEKTAVAVVPDNQLSLAIGQEGQNVRLAAKLTGWKIDIISESQHNEQSQEEV